MAQTRHPSEPAFLKGNPADQSAPVLLARLPRRVLLGALLVRWGLAFVLGTFGAVKMSPVAAQLVQPLVANSPALDWLYSYLSVENVARAAGAVEIGAALMLFAGVLSPVLALCGSLLAVFIFVITLSFLFTTPGALVAFPGLPLPAPSAMTAFIVKDAFLLGAAAWSLIVALRVLRVRRNVRRAAPASEAPETAA
jgi:reactive chlorine resistance protein C